MIKDGIEWFAYLLVSFESLRRTFRSTSKACALLPGPLLRLAQLPGPLLRLAQLSGPLLRLAQLSGPLLRLAQLSGPLLRLAPYFPVHF